MPRLGGVAIYLTLCFSVLLSLIARRYFGIWVTFRPHVLYALMAPATLIFLLGLVDDLIGLKAHFKFAVQAVAAVVLYLDGFGISRLSFRAGGQEFGWIIGLPLTILWVLWITNAFNLIDGLDGLAAGSALFSTLVICAMALINRDHVIVILTLALSGAVLGFLRYNFHPATIFLGD
ncbi:MAG TPA: MraY family glycosyltransferase, partial [Terriglobales bacterium]